MRARLALIFGLLLFLGCLFSPAAAQAPRPSSPMILALGSTSWLNASDIQAATGAVVKQDMGQFQLKDFAVIVLANVAFAGLPGPVQQGLVDYVTNGGAVLITGGTQSFGSGGYQAVASIIPFRMRYPNDWTFAAFRFPVPLQPGHPILAGVSFISVGALNNMDPRPDAVEILQKGAGGVAGFINPLIAEVSAGAGRVIGIAFDLNDLAGMRDRDLFVRNTMGYLLRASRMGRG
jgi:hypothetical protein